MPKEKQIKSKIILYIFIILYKMLYNKFFLIIILNIK